MASDNYLSLLKSFTRECRKINPSCLHRRCITKIIVVGKCVPRCVVCVVNWWCGDTAKQSLCFKSCRRRRGLEASGKRLTFLFGESRRIICVCVLDTITYPNGFFLDTVLWTHWQDAFLLTIIFHDKQRCDYGRSRKGWSWSTYQQCLVCGMIFLLFLSK